MAIGPATFTLSFDCEGRWGMADRPDPAATAHLTNQDLAGVYRDLVERLDRAGIRATFAFVSAFCLSREEVDANPDWFAPQPYRGSDWFAAFRRDLADGATGGWLCPDALAAVRAAPAHEIAAHGFCHVPLGDDDVDDASFDREMSSLRAAEGVLGLASDTFVFPRNRVGHLRALAAHGFRGYRPQDPLERARGPLAKVQRVLADLTAWEAPKPHGAAVEPVALPAGRLLPLRTGVRRAIPAAAVRRKFAVMLERAATQGEAIHVYAHPHDFLAGRDQWAVFDAMLAAVAERARHGEVRVLTQRDYCDWLTGPARGRAGALLAVR